MGMFDTIIINTDTGFTPDDEFAYQTKDLGSCLDYYEIRDDGTLWKRPNPEYESYEYQQQILDDYIWTIGSRGNNYFDLNMWFKNGVVQSFDDGKEKYHLTEWGKNNEEVVKWLEENRTP